MSGSPPSPRLRRTSRRFSGGWQPDQAVFPTGAKESAAPQAHSHNFGLNRGALAGIAVAMISTEHAMTRSTAFLLVLMLTSLPAASAVCVTWCESQPATTTAHCHQQESPAISSAQTACAALKDNPFVRQDSRVALNAAPGLSLVDMPEAFLMQERGTMLSRNDVARSAPTQRSLVLRL